MVLVVITNDQELNHAGVRVENINEQKLQKLQAEILRYRERLDNEGFRRSAKPQVQQQHEDKVLLKQFVKNFFNTVFKLSYLIVYLDKRATNGN